MEATALWIVVPNHRVARAVRRQLRRLGVREQEPRIQCLTLGEAMERLKDFSSVFFPDEGQKGKEKK